jgi:8-oxo-dGTP pyrophosphatase MutT (NUDIX family)
MKNNFNVRVYGVYIRDQKVLVAQERYGTFEFYKFPGGGLEFGEGTRKCLQREFYEELGIHIEVGEHAYTTDFFQESKFNSSEQIISIYYWIDEIIDLDIQVLNEQLMSNQQGVLKLHWLDLCALDQLELPIDQYFIQRILLPTQFH